MGALNATWSKGMMLDDPAKRAEMRTNMHCDLTPHVMLNSHGVWERSMASGSEDMAFWEHPLPRLEIIILTTFVLWRFFDMIFKKLGVPMPQFTSMMLVGAVLGEAFQPVQVSWFRKIFISDDDNYLPNVAETIGTFAFALNWFLRGVTTNVGLIKRSGAKSFVIGIASMIIPWNFGRFVYSYRDKSSILNMTYKEYGVIIFTMSMTPFTCINMLLKDLTIVHTEFGQIAQSSAMVTDILAFSMRVWSHLSRDYYYGMRLGVYFMIFFIFLYLVRQAMLWVIRHTSEGAQVRNIYIYLVLLLAYFSYLYWTHFLFLGLLGPFVLGLAIPNGPPIGSEFIKRFDSFNVGILLPLFGSLSIIKLDWSSLMKELGDREHLYAHMHEVVSFILIVYITKFMTSFLVAISSKMPLRDSIILSLILGTKSSFELSYVLYAYEKNSICREVFTFIGFYILVNSLLTPMAIHFLYDRSQRFVCYGKRNVKYRSELHPLVCINKPDNITSMIDLLKTTSPSKESPMVCSVLHLIELVGQATPSFISHQLQKPKPGRRSYSENVISSFQVFQETRGDSTTIDIFTSFTPAKEMHDHVCWFALDKSLNLILLSFHRTWGFNGIEIVSDDQTLRSHNRNILKRAPCSVGLLVHRRPIWQIKSPDSPCRVCLIYVGGNDDEEALALAYRMKDNKKVNIATLRLIPACHAGESSESRENKMVPMNSEEESPRDESIKYIDRAVADGTETSQILHSIAYDYDLFMVGRTSGVGTVVTKGLGDWIEFEELGVIGDLLASEYYPSRASVLIVQQQE